ncbi:hypothetical protein BLNAU_20926 [Blattamonas nauphoetae]|uniref:Uncharacterized protein n=1 Tax=Blattamonas nauphoetae TaxID=2049346 RepID=A0ABQ9WXE3_9EUKA|nr:hypothetical protein BLNAU_20926 [Blattamonas nauphoetae]
MHRALFLYSILLLTLLSSLKTKRHTFRTVPYVPNPCPTWFMSLEELDGIVIRLSFFATKRQTNTQRISMQGQGGVGQRVVMEADGREGKRTLKLSQDGETQPVFFSNIPVPFRFIVHPYDGGNSVEIVSTEVLREPSMVGGNSKVVMD